MTGPRTSASGLLQGDHEELDQLLESFEGATEEPPAARQERFARFATGLRQHILVEERDLFPRFAEGGAAHHALVDRLLGEHARIEAALRKIEAELRTVSGTVPEAVLELVDVLWEHNAREEGAVYPWFDHHLAPEEVEELDRRLHPAGAGSGSPG